MVQTSLFALRWELNPHLKHTLFDSTVELPRDVFLFGSLDDISITHSFVKVNRLMIFFSLARRVGFEPTDSFPPPIFKTGAFSRSAISAYYWRGRRDLNPRAAFDGLLP